MSDPHPWTHGELCEAAKRYLLDTLGCGFAFSEFVTAAGEIPDAIGFKHNVSILIEAKTSRRDFLADKAKLWRRIPGAGMGDIRFYLAPSGLLAPEDMPPRWGLIEASGTPSRAKLRRVHGPKGSHATWGPYRTTDWWHIADRAHERAMFYSALRRLHLRGLLDEIYRPEGESA